MSHLFDKDSHLTNDSLQALKASSLSEVELISAVSHLVDCEKCANTYADSFSVNELLEVPSNFAERIEESRLLKNKVDKQLVFYSLRVAIAVCAALVIVFSGSLNFIISVNTRIANFKPPDLNFVNPINVGLQDFSQKLLSMEVFQNEKEKK